MARFKDMLRVARVASRLLARRALLALDDEVGIARHQRIAAAGELLAQAHEFHDGIRSAHKRLHVFTLEEDGSNDHCQIDNLARGNQVVFDWLDELFQHRSAGARPAD